MIYVIRWYYHDGSAHGVLPTAYKDEAMAKHVYEAISADFNKEYELLALTLFGSEPQTKEYPDVGYTLRCQGTTPPWLELVGKPGTPLSALNLMVRAERCLKAEGIETVEQLLLCPERILLRFPSLGRKTINEIKFTLAAKGMRLPA